MAVFQTMVRVSSANGAQISQFNPLSAQFNPWIPQLNPPFTLFVTSLIFFSLPFWKTGRKTTKKARISSACRTPKILGKEGKNAQNRKEFLEKEKGKENQKGKEVEIRALLPQESLTTVWKLQFTHRWLLPETPCMTHAVKHRPSNELRRAFRYSRRGYPARARCVCMCLCQEGSKDQVCRSDLEYRANQNYVRINLFGGTDLYL